MKEKVICGIQQLGVGVADVNVAMKWYNRVFGFDVRILDDQGVAERMLPYTGGKPQPRHAMLMINLRGGGGLEIWEPQQRTLNYLETPAEVGDLGVFAGKIKTPDITAAYGYLKTQAVKLINEPSTDLCGRMHFFMEDPWGNVFSIEEDNYVFVDEKKFLGGVNGAIIGVSDMEKSIEFYGKLTQYDKVVADRTGVFDDLKGLPGARQKVRRVVLRPSREPRGPLSQVLGTSQIELIQVLDGTPRKLYANRYWGDPGFIHLCFDVRNMDMVQRDAEALGHPFVCDGGADFDMGDANGHFTYVEDADGVLIEFVETFKVPVLAKWGIYLNLGKKDDYKPLPKFMTRALRFLKVKA